MKKALIASTALVMSAGVAAADVTLSGYGRTGIIYYENVDGDNTTSESQIISRMRLNIDASTETDNGVAFGGRIRLQYDQGSDDQSQPNAAKLFVTSNGLTVEIGNVDTAFDSNGLIYETELGSYDRSVGFSDRTGAFFAYDSNAYANVDRVGVRVLYEIDSLTVQASYVDPDQSGWNETSGFIDSDGNGIIGSIGDDYIAAVEEEIGLSVDYTWNERLELSAAYVTNGAGVEDNDIFFVGARYAVMDNARIGLNYVDASNNSVADDGNTIAIYGDYTLADGLTNIEAYVANNDADWNETDNAFGVGVNYDLGGARLGASLQRDHQERVTADMGVRFDF